MNTATTDRNLYGATEINGLVNGTSYHTDRSGQIRMTLKAFAAKKGRVSRVRALTELRGMGEMIVDVSYCHGELPDGTLVDIIDGPLGELAPSRRGVRGVLIDWAQSQGVYAIGIGLIDPAVVSTLD